MRNYALLENDGSSLAVAYLLALASFYIYDLEQEGWSCFKKRFIKDYTQWLKTYPTENTIVKLIQDTSTSTQVAVMSNSSSVIVVFRGTESNSIDWLGNIPVPPLRTISTPSSGSNNVKVHTGWWGNLDSVYDQVRSEVIAQGAASKRLWLTGHSLGGSLAVLAGYRLQVLDGINIEMIQTFGCPKVGNSTFQHSFTSSSSQLTTTTLIKTRRWVNFLDPVPLLPANPIYNHVGIINNIHADHSIEQDNEMSYVSTNPKYHAIDKEYCKWIYNKLDRDEKRKIPLVWKSGLKLVGAAFLISPESAYFFDGSKYTRYTPGEGADSNYPKRIVDHWNNWPTNWSNGFDCVIKWTNGKYYFFKDTHYLRYTPGRGVDPGYPKPIVGNWDGWPLTWINGPDAAMLWPIGNRAYFFCGHEYIRYNPGHGVDSGYPKPIAGNWPGWPTSWLMGIDTGLIWTNNKAYFFKGNQYIRYTPGNGVDTGYPKPIRCYWYRLLKPA